MLPNVHVIMPIYNGAKHLSKAIESLIKQSYVDWECLCLDDGSTDRSPSIVEDYARRDGRVLLIRLSHAGIVETLNRGVANSTGRYIASSIATI